MGCIVWLTGLSNSGKSTIARSLRYRLTLNGIPNFLLDADEIRTGLNSDLSFSKKDRDENVRRIGEVAIMLVNTDMVVIVACVSPYLLARQKIKEKTGRDRFLEVYLNAPIDICHQRDTKNLYNRALAGEIKLAGVNDVYEPPVNALEIDTSKLDIHQCTSMIMDELKKRYFC
jgi:adenylylsulfate kinase